MVVTRFPYWSSFRAGCLERLVPRVLHDPVEVLTIEQLGLSRRVDPEIRRSPGSVFQPDRVLGPHVGGCGPSFLQPGPDAHRQAIRLVDPNAPEEVPVIGVARIRGAPRWFRLEIQHPGRPAIQGLQPAVGESDPACQAMVPGCRGGWPGAAPSGAGSRPRDDAGSRRAIQASNTRTKPTAGGSR